MMAKTVTCYATISILVLFTQTYAQKTFLVDYQIHSNNDLLEWSQLLHKGATRFKVDPHFVQASSCKKLGIASPDGCFLLNHDTPVVEINEFYNSSDDLLDYLSLITATAGPKLTISLCFKSAPDWCIANSSSFQSWLRLVDAFYDRATKLFINNDNVEFVLDGNAKPKNCLVGRWPLWNSVWINSDSPADAYWSNSQEVGSWFC